MWLSGHLAAVGASRVESLRLPFTADEESLEREEKNREKTGGELQSNKKQDSEVL